MIKNILIFALLVCFGNSIAQDNINLNKFRQLKYELATPNVYRTASGAPGHQYYQQKADYDIKLTLDDNTQIIYGTETITYTNNSPDKLEYLWIQLDQNVRAKTSDTKLISTQKIGKKMSFSQLESMHSDFDGGFKLDYVKDADNKNLKYTVNKTMMRVDLAAPLQAGATFKINIKWNYLINNRDKNRGRSGYEYFPENDNYHYTIAQFYPRMAVYNEVEGWQNKQFLGRGEFTLPFGDYKVSITVPTDHIVGATGVLDNANKVLTKEQQNRFKKAQNEFEQPIMIVTQKEAEKAEKGKAKNTKTWKYSATNVRDFAFASSRKFIWDAMAVKIGDKQTMAMSYYPKEGNPLWEQYSTKIVAHTLRSYSKHTVNYPYPVAISVHAKSIGMEYPMICFNGGRPHKDGTYSKGTKYAMIGVIIHEVGHNFFPMIINSDERQWTWMDEGLNTFTQYLAETEWERDYPHRRGPAYKIVDYMKGDKKNITPIMTNSESIFQFGNNAYGKPATALNILRETVMGRKLFDFAFKTYCERWKFKHPTPADFFRTMEDASGVDLDWFWRGWFYTTDHCDMGIKNVNWFKASTGNPGIEKEFAKNQKDANATFIGDTRNKTDINETAVEKDPSNKDFYSTYSPFDVTYLDKKKYKNYVKKLSDNEKKLLGLNYNYYTIEFESPGGLLMPLILKFTFKDGTNEVVRIPAEIWKTNHKQVAKTFFFKKEVVDIALDPFLETADINLNNNNWPPKLQLSKFQLFQQKKYGWGENGKKNAMQKAKKK